jgi:hypothetical protein
LREQVRALLLDAATAYRGTPAEQLLRQEVARVDGPLRVAIAGRVKAGKSTLLNALVGEQVAATDATECTRVVTAYAEGEREAAWAYLPDGSSIEVALRREAGGTHIDLAGLAGHDTGGVEALRVELPNPRLQRLTLIDTPGIASLSEELSRQAESFLLPGTRQPPTGMAAGVKSTALTPGTPGIHGIPGASEGPATDGRLPGSPAATGPAPAGSAGSVPAGLTPGGVMGTGADAVVYLLRFLHAADVGFLESFRRTGVGEATPAHAIGVLSRADEVAPGRTESVDLARRAAADIGRDERVRALVQTVVPVAGLLAQADSRLAADELAQLIALARGPGEAVDELLLSADHFAADQAATGVPASLRALLLDRLGLAGIRLAVALVRLGEARDPARLAAELAARSGLPELRTLLREQFTERADVLKAQTALRVLDDVLDAYPHRSAAALRARRERIEAGAHALAELRLLGDLRTGATDLRGLNEDRRQGMERLLGTAGTGVHARLGLPADADPAEVRAAVLTTLDTYRRLSENRLAARSVRRAAAVLRRTCEGLLRATAKT